MCVIIDCFQDKTSGRELLETDDFSDFVPVITKIVRQENSFKIIFLLTSIVTGQSQILKM